MRKSKPFTLTLDTAQKWWGLLASIGTVFLASVAYAVNLQTKVESLESKVKTIQEDRTRNQDEWRRWREEQTKDLSAVKADIAWIVREMKK